MYVDNSLDKVRREGTSLTALRPYQIVSLLEMLERYAFSFYEVVIRLEKLRNIAAAYASSSYGATSKPYKWDREGMSESLLAMHKECEVLDLASTADLIMFMGSELQRKGEDYNYNDLLKDVETLSFSFANDLRKRFFFRIPDNKQDFFQKDDLFGVEVTQAFPSCGDNIRNAGSCYALEQWDASVFHLMTILGRGLDAMATKFGVPFQNTTWHTVIEQIEAKVRKMDSSFGPDWKDQQKFYSQAASQFMFLKDAWRNHVMHGRDVYDEGKALSIFTHVRLVMRALAEGGLVE
jgi:hypothetical protein